MARDTSPELELTIRRAGAEDARALTRVAQRDSRGTPQGALLLAEVDGEVVAVVPVEGGEPVADPFRRTAEVVSLLEQRAAELRTGEAALTHVPRAARTGRALRALAR